MPCITRSNQSIGLVSVPLKSILSFSTIWGSGMKGASPSVTQARIIIPQDSSFIKLIMGIL